MSTHPKTWLNHLEIYLSLAPTIRVIPSDSVGLNVCALVPTFVTKLTFTLFSFSLKESSQNVSVRDLYT